MTNDEWAQFHGYATMVAYNVARSFPNATTLTLFRDTMYSNINSENNDSAITGLDNFLRGVEKRGVDMMLEEELLARRNLPPPQFQPKDYIFKRDRDKIKGKSKGTFNRGVGT